jgi:xanthine dehydrogenase accessory factor
MNERVPAVDWLRPLEGAWPGAVVRLLERSPAAVRVVVASMRGSAPRDPGASLLVTRDTLEGTIGGGHLEFEAIQMAREFLNAEEHQPAVQIRQLILGQDLRQCCGGAVRLWLERFTIGDLPMLQAAAQAAQAARGSDSAMLESAFDGMRVTRRLIVAKSPESMRFTSDAVHAGTLLERLGAPRQSLWIFGAGHVGQAIVRALSDLPFDITWVDSRPGVLPSSLPANVRALEEPQPAGLLAEAPEDAMYIVLTHDHALDYSLCHSILRRDAFAWLGLIGSDSKAARFRSRFRKDGIAPALIGKLVCPIGVSGIESKAPAAIAIAVAAQLLQTLRTPAAVSTLRTGIARIGVRPAPAPSQRAAHDCGANCGGCSSSQETP